VFGSLRAFVWWLFYALRTKAKRSVKTRTMGIKSGIRKVSRGANLTHPKLTPWGVVLIAASVAAILIGIAIAKWSVAKGKGVVGGVLPGAAGKESARNTLGI